MSNSSPSLGRPADRMNLIVQELRGRIVAGDLMPGGQLPTRVEIERHFGASPATVQKALEHLRKDGFVEVNGKQGTFVVPNPPHLTRYAIVFPDYPESPHWRRFWTALSEEVIRLEASHSRPVDVHLPIYYGVDGSLNSTETDRLIREVEGHQLAGLVFTTSPHLLEHTPIGSKAGIPRVAIMTSGDNLDISAVCLDYAAFCEKAVRYLAECGRRRIAIVSPPLQMSLWDRWSAPIAKYGMTTFPYWMLMVHLDCPEAARNCVHLLMESDPSRRPDCLVVGDDNLVPNVIAGLQAAGMRVPEDIEIVAHSNFPWPVPSDLPIKYLGFDARLFIAACIESIERQRAGDMARTVTRIPAIFEDEQLM